MAGVFLLGCGTEETALVRGDVAWADSAYAEALAEYRLAASQSDAPEVLARVAHAYARMGETTRATEWYERLLARDDEYATQALYDYLRLARRAAERGDGHDLATALEAALALDSTLAIGELAPRVARYYAETGDIGRAIVFYERALAAAPPDSAPRYLYEIGRLYQTQGDCRQALGFLTAFRHVETRGVARVGERGDAAPGQPPAIDRELRGSARWALGACAFEEAKRMHQEGKLAEALQHLETVIGLGVPENVQDHAWFQRGEILYAIGRRSEALESYYRVLELNPVGQGQLVERARRRIDQIRFGS